MFLPPSGSAANPLAVVLQCRRAVDRSKCRPSPPNSTWRQTTFVLPPKDAALTAQVRIFTPRGEMPFAGHPNVGTAFVLARAGASYGKTIAGERCHLRGKRPVWSRSPIAEGCWKRRGRAARFSAICSRLGAEVAAERIRIGLRVQGRSMTFETAQTTGLASPPAARPFIFARTEDPRCAGPRQARAPIFSCRKSAKYLGVTSILLYTEVE